MIPNVPRSRWPISRAFLAALLFAAAGIVKDPKNLETWSVAAGIIAAAVSSGARKDPNGK